MAALVWIAANLRAVLAPHLAFEFMDPRCLRSPHDVEVKGLMRVAAKAFHFEIAKPGVDRVTQRGRWSSRSLKAEHALVPRVDGEPGLPSFRRPHCRRPHRCRKWSRVTWCPCGRGCARPRRTGKPLQIAVDGLPGTTVAMQLVKSAFEGKAEVRFRDRQGSF
jgi:hypothetical protein